MGSPVEILLVDDEPRNLAALEAILDDPGYRLLRAEDADRALQLLLAHDVAAIILDIKLPGVSGFELARMIKDTKRFRDTPIMFLTAYLVDDQDVIAGYGAGGVDYLTKPVNPTILRHKIAIFADLFRKTRELAEVNAKLARLNENLEARVKDRTLELEKSEAALRAAAAQKDEFLAVLAHELRNPLAPLRTGVDILLRVHGDAPPPPVGRTLAAMNRQLQHMVRLIDDLLDVSRLSRGLLELKREQVDLGAIVSATVDSVRTWFEKREQVVSVEVTQPLLAQADSTRVAQVLTNLLHNAAKFTPKGGSVRIEARKEAGQALIRVSDSGAGVRADQLERVFDMFARVDRPAVSAEPGLGIGLALARRLADMHGGSLELSSEGEGRGATFTLRLPLAAEAQPAAPVAANATGAEPAASGEQAAKLSVVVVEDNDDIASVLVDWLRELGHDVSVAQTGNAGIAAIESTQPDAVVCDLGLPDLDGLGVCRRVRLLPSEVQPVMVALTGWGREEDVRRSKEAGFDHHLVKPVAPEALNAVLNSISEARARRAPLAAQPASTST
jgi:signal transduction histidine kinase